MDRLQVIASEPEDVPAVMRSLGQAARHAQRALANAASVTKNKALTAAAMAIRHAESVILEANARDLAEARQPT